MKEQQMFYAEPQHYWPAENKSGTELDRLREQVQAAEATAAKALDWTQRVRAEQDVKTLQRELEAAEGTAVKQTQVARQRQEARQEDAVEHRFIRNRNGDYLFVRNTDTPAAQPQYMPISTNKSGGGSVQWPESFRERHALVTAAIAELRQAGVA